ncbi:hypothetical protein LA080_012555 [Diaporthe eres]|nr:hypothetical protein LA080_012555 [Diaporthe eres]
MEIPIEGGSPAKRELVFVKKSDQNALQIATTTAETFPQFPDLPKELRLKIWEQAMIEARPSRRIIIDEGRVVPFKRLIGPLLLVNYESRTFTQDQVKHLDKQENWGRIEGSDRAVDGNIHGYNDEWVENEFENRRLNAEFSDEPDFDYGDRFVEIDRIDREEKEYTVDLEEHWSDFIRDELRVLGASSIRRAETSGLHTGAFYISPEHDIFITDYDCTAHFSIDSASRILGTDFPSIQDISRHHISEKLPAAIYQRVSNLVLVRLRNFWNMRVAEDRHCVFTDNKTVRAHFVLWHLDDGQEKGDFLTRITEMNDFKFSECLDLWEWDEFNRHGRVIPVLKKKKDRFSAEKVDWARDLMAHWNTSN